MANKPNEHDVKPCVSNQTWAFASSPEPISAEINEQENIFITAKSKWVWFPYFSWTFCVILAGHIYMLIKKKRETCWMFNKMDMCVLKMNFRNLYWPALKKLTFLACCCIYFWLTYERLCTLYFCPPVCLSVRCMLWQTLRFLRTFQISDFRFTIVVKISIMAKPFQHSRFNLKSFEQYPKVSQKWKPTYILAHVFKFLP